MAWMIKVIIWFTLLCSSAGNLWAQLPSNYQLKYDWLLERNAFKASVKIDRETGRIVMSNGLFERVIDQKLGTTIAYNNLMTEQTVIRAVEPEGKVTINGEEYLIGGVKGQTNKAFIDEKTLKSLRPSENALRYVGHEVSEPKERLKWARVRRAAADSTWPPKGVALRLDYRLPERSSNATAALDTADGRELLWKDDFLKMDDSWAIRTSPLHERSSFANEGKAGEIYTLPNTVVMAERPIPAEVKMVEASIHPGIDPSTSYGPGIAIVFENQKVIKLNLRPGGLANVNRPVLGVFNGKIELPNVSGDERLDITKAWQLRMSWEGQELLCEARPLGGVWKIYHRQLLNTEDGLPKSFRVGKLAKMAAVEDGDAVGDLCRLKVDQVAFYSARDPQKINKSANGKNCLISVHYEIYDGLPCLSKWITVKNEGSERVVLDRFNAETLSVVEYASPVETREQRQIEKPDALHVETDMAMGGLSLENSDIFSVHWQPDPDYKSQVNYMLQTPALLKVEPVRGPAQDIEPQATFESFRVFELVYDSTDRERRGLSLRRMYRTIAPWVTENPLMLHCKSVDPEVVKKSIDQAAETGFELVILSFGSGFDMENKNPEYFAKWKQINDYARTKGVELGSYSLYSSRKLAAPDAIVPPKGGSLAHGNCPAITSEWGQNYLKSLNNALTLTGFSAFEHDGPYPGDEDVTERLPLQKGLDDSRWVHWKIWSEFYKELRGKGIYMNLPDYYYLNGANKCTMGYREVNWSLPREEQRIHTRQNIYDGTWQKTPSMGWMFVPLIQYQGGGAAATIEPLHQHLDHYEIMMRSNLAMGVQACYRGTRIYDTEETKRMVQGVVSWYKKHREILDSDLIHGRRADGLDLDWMLHVNPRGDEKGMVVVFNPTNQAIQKKLSIPTYYTGLGGKAAVSIDGKKAQILSIDADRLFLDLEVPANGFAYAVLKSAK